MQILKAIFIFYKKLVIPTIIMSGLIAFTGMNIAGELSFITFGISYIFFGIFFHYFIYELRNINEYYFYYNMGLSKQSLWVLTMILNLIIGLIFMFL